ncbi:phosphatidate cytidylyltransferase [Aromatoleum buckelii]|uniref:Phosphatidate cytidylyltransferase n=1 Tax=Aromatoleum buckelii TaxID=200254 RepID=A0ABX1N6M6_9RHOO|nr:phosphatidate cytidylyltransferase [Aromatoleum buckelii]MCK0512748.1 phosphatidate cytidylyltransferase [Aromatoleum buckelii]
MLRTRVITALVLLAGLLAGIFLLPPWGWLTLAAIICAAAAWEWGGLGGFAVGPRGVFAALMGIACLLTGAMSGLAGDGVSPPAGLAALYLASGMFWVAVVPLWLARKWRITGAAGTVLVGLVVLLPPALALAHLRMLGPWLLLAVMAATFVSDIAAYFTGRAFGRHKLAPAISPGKTWEGAGGAVAGVLVFALIVLASRAPSLLDAPTVLLVVPLLAAFTAVGVLGDLFESLLKRQAGVKDSGSMLPGHGGILDRIDSLTSTLPLAGLAALWLAL